jgi:hypothetical protein
MLLVITSRKAALIAVIVVLPGSVTGHRYWWIARKAKGVSMLVYIDTASAVNSRAVKGSQSAMSWFLSSNELEKKEHCAWAMGCSFRSTQMPRGCSKLPLQETMGHVDNGILLILMVPYRTGNGSSSSLASLLHKNCRSILVSMVPYLSIQSVRSHQSRRSKHDTCVNERYR